MSGERRKVRVGTVIQERMNKTVVVAVEWRRPHKLYRKPVRRRTRFYAHDESNECRIGDRVRIIETRPLSKMKRWRVVEVLSSVDIAEIAPQEIDREVIEGGDLPQAANEEEGETPVLETTVVHGAADSTEAGVESEEDPTPSGVAGVETQPVGDATAEAEVAPDDEVQQKKEDSE